MGLRDLRLFPSTFWIANTVELLERLAYYGLNVVLALYLVRRVGYDDAAAVAITGIFISSLYLLPIPAGAISDKIGFRKGLLIAFSLLALGYASLGIFPTKVMIFPALGLIALGGSFVKPVISGTVKKTSPEGLSKLGFSIFYTIVNLGGFSGKIMAKALRQNLGEKLSRSGYTWLETWVEAHVPPFHVTPEIAARAAQQKPPMEPEAFVEMLKWQGLGMQAVCFFSTAMAIVAMLFVLTSYRESDRAGEAMRSAKETFADIFKVLSDGPFIVFVLIFAGFDLMFWQLYLSVPIYILRHISERAPMEYIVAINPGMIILLQMPVAWAMGRLRPISAMALGMAISTAAMIMLGLLQSLAGACMAIAVFALGEMTFAPRFLDYVADMAPRGKVGLYLGYSYLRSFIANAAGGPLTGYFVQRYIPETGKRQPETMWFSFAAIGVASLVSLFLYSRWAGHRKAIDSPAGS